MGAPFVWFDLTAADGGKVRDFYADLFGWTIGPGAGDYQGWITDGDQPWAGIAAAGAADGGRWVPYVVVDDLDAAVRQAVGLGGTVVKDRTAGPAGTSITVADPGGALIALFTPAAG
jgi:predicted enzyme related to lactoylglutathione lyase